MALPLRQTSHPGFISAQTGPRPSRFREVAPVRFTTSSLAYALFLSVVAALFLRPGELIPAFQGLPIYEFCILGAFALAFPVMQNHISKRALIQEPINVCVLWLFAAMMISHASHFYFYGIYESFTEFGKTLILFATLVTVVNTPKRFRGLLLATALVGSLMVLLCVVDFVGFVDFQFITHLSDIDDDVDETGARKRVMRMRGTGLFQDPNDLAMVIIACSVLCLYFLEDRRAGFARFLWLVPGAVLTIGLFMTRSRGGLLAGGVAFLALVSARFGRRYVIVAALLGAAALPLVAGRQANIDLEGGTAHERVLMWREGFAELVSPQILCGIGHDMYADIAGLVAHNSYIHTYVELGIFGGTAFFGCWWFFFLALSRLGGEGSAFRDPELKRATPYVGAMIAGWCASMFSLSRAYVPPTFLVLGIGATFINLCCLNLKRPRLLIKTDTRHLKLLAYSSASMFVFLYLFVRFVA